MSPQGWGFLDKMDQLSLEDMLAILRPYLTNMVRKGRKSSPVGPNPTQSLPLTLQHPATYLPPSLGSSCWILVLSRNPLDMTQHGSQKGKIITTSFSSQTTCEHTLSARSCAVLSTRTGIQITPSSLQLRSRDFHYPCYRWETEAQGFVVGKGQRQSLCQSSDSGA